MCGIIGGISNKNITPLLLEGLKKLEYRGYDSAGLVVQSKNSKLLRLRSVGKVINLEKKLKITEVKGEIGLAHTRWATHGKPSVKNAHPHTSKDTVSIVHNGIIENYIDLKDLQTEQGYDFNSDTDSEVIANAIHSSLQSSNSFVEAVSSALRTFKGSYGLGVISLKHPNTLIAARKNSPLLIGVSNNGNYIASDQMALLSVTNKFIFLEEGDIAELTLHKVTIYNKDGNVVKRPIKVSHLKAVSYTHLTLPTNREV